MGKTKELWKDYQGQHCIVWAKRPSAISFDEKVTTAWLVGNLKKYKIHQLPSVWAPCQILPHGVRMIIIWTIQRRLGRKVWIGRNQYQTPWRQHDLGTWAADERDCVPQGLWMSLSAWQWGWWRSPLTSWSDLSPVEKLRRELKG